MSLSRRTVHIYYAAVFCIILAALYVNSAVFFRMRSAESYTNDGQYIKAQQVYSKILARDKVKKNIREQEKTQIYFELGRLYSKLNLENSAIESYAMGSSASALADLRKYYKGTGLVEGKLFATGLLEGGRFRDAAEELLELQHRYPHFSDSEKYINAAGWLERQSVGRPEEEALFLTGEAYIRNRLFRDARLYFTKRILDYGVHPLKVLEYLHEMYSADDEMRGEVWGEEIYVTLEDFENTSPQLSLWASNTKPVVKHHYIAQGTAYKGNNSEFMEIAYGRKGYDLWVKNMVIPLGRPDLKLGVRLFIKTTSPSTHNLSFNVCYPEQKATGIYSELSERFAEDGWERYSIEDLSEVSRRMPAKIGCDWNDGGMFIDQIILNNGGISDSFYVDEIELYLKRRKG